MKIKTLTLAIVILAFLTIGIAGTSAMGWWNTSNGKGQATFKDGPFAGEPDPSDIRGSNSFQEIADGFGIPLEDLGLAFGVNDPADYATFRCKDLESGYEYLKESGIEIGTGSVRYFTALYTGLPLESDETAYLLQPAVDILKEKAVLTAEQLAYLDSHTVTSEMLTDMPAVTPDEQTVADQTPLPEETPASEPANTVTPAPKAPVTAVPSKDAAPAVSSKAEASTSDSSAKTTETHEPATSSPSGTGSGTGDGEGANFTSSLTIKGNTTFQDLMDAGVKKDDIEKVLKEKLSDPAMKIRDYTTDKGLEFADYKEALQALVDQLK